MTAQEVKQIKIGKHMIGIVDLRSTFEEVARDGVNQTDASLSRMLLEKKWTDLGRNQ